MHTPTTSRLPSVSRRLRLPSRAAWLSARATNVVRRPGYVALWWLGLGVALGGLVLLSQLGTTATAPLVATMVGVTGASLFGAVTAALVAEMRHPRVANAADAERLSGLRVLTTARLRPVPAQRARRAVDRTLPWWLDPGADEYRIVAWHLTTAWPRDGAVTVACEEPIVGALVGTNLAATLAVDARSTLLVDVDFTHEPVRTLLKLANSPGLVAVMENRRRWSESLIPYTVGRSRTMHILPSGRRDRPPGPAESAATAGELQRAARRHDATVLVSTPRQARTLRTGDDLVLVVLEGHTRIERFEADVAALIDGGARIRGIVLWQGGLPRVAALPPGASIR